MKKHFALAALLISACCANAADNPSTFDVLRNNPEIILEADIDASEALGLLAEATTKNTSMSFDGALAIGKFADDNFDMDKNKGRKILQACASIVAHELAPQNIETSQTLQADEIFNVFHNNLLKTVSGNEMIPNINGGYSTPNLNRFEWKIYTALLQGDDINPLTKTIFAHYLKSAVIEKPRKKALDAFINTTNQDNEMSVSAKECPLVMTHDASGNPVPYTINGICQTIDADGNMTDYIVDGTPVTADAHGNIVHFS